MAPTFSTDWKDHNASDAAIAKFEAKFAKNMGVELIRTDKIEHYRVIPTGSLALDDATGIGGYPVGRVIELWGPEHVSKTTLGMLAVANAQRTQPNKIPAWVDMEQTFDEAWAAALGVDLARLWRPKKKPATAEDVADATKEFVLSGLCSVVVLDSIGGMITRMQYEKNAEDPTVASVARVVTRMVQQVSPIGHANNTTTLVINQVRSNIAKYGADTTTPGGWALKHITSMKLKVSRGGERPKTVRSDGGDVPVGYEVSVKVEKNKCAPYGSVGSFWLFNRPTDKYGPVGVNQAKEAAVMGPRYGVIATKGAWYTLPNEHRCNGKDALEEYLMTHPEQVEEIRAALLARHADQIVEEPDDEFTIGAETLDSL